MARESGELIQVFRLTIPAMSDVTDEELLSDIEIYRDYVSEKRFGKLFPKALAYFVAHMRTLNEMIANAANDGGAGSVSLTAGNLTREVEGDIERDYSAANAAANSSNGDALLSKTLYGQLFLQLREMTIVPVTIRSGVCGGR